MNKILRTMRHEFVQVLPPTLFFFVAFNLISLTNSLMLRQYGIDVYGFATATVGALLVGKVVLVADKLPFINRFPDRPLIYNVVWKTMIYVLAVFAVRYVEHLIPFLREHGSFGLAHHHLLDEVVWPRFWSVQIWLLVLFFVYSALHELIKQIGREAALQMFLGYPRRADR